MSDGRMFAVPVQGRDTDERYTPQWVFDGLGLTFDLDPCSPLEGGDCVPACRKFTVADDGLSQPWEGSVWLNPPYSESTAWVRKFITHGHGVFLGPYANAAWYHELIDVADLVWFVRDFAFTHPTHTGRRAGMALSFVALGAEACAGLRRLAGSGLHRGTLMVRAV